MVEYINTPVTRLSGISSKNCLKYNRITNCITEIPQDIKLELNEGTLTLKAGSKIYIPNGFEADGVTKKFDVKVIENDVVTVSASVTDKNVRLVYLNISRNNLGMFATHLSGTTPPSSGVNRMFYNTNTNIIRKYDNGVMDTNIYSLPIVSITANGSNVTGSINQIFNGFGYIGSTIFALPGVKGLMPNGLNKDGTLKNIELILNSIVIQTASNVTTFTDIRIYKNAVGMGLLYYDEKENKNFDKDNYFLECLSAGKANIQDGKITSLTPKTAFRALDYNDTSYISSQVFPSDKSISLTLGSSGTSYTAPADGYILFERGSTNGTKYISLHNITSSIGVIGESASGVANARIFLPVKKEMYLM